jgi:zinc protease
MTAAARQETSTNSDADLWSLVRGGSTSAFEVVVRRYQSLVCSVAYSVCGNLAQSEDVAQETFWAAWRQRASLVQPERLRGWLCGIARNLAKNAQRRVSPKIDSGAGEGKLAELSAEDAGPVDEAVTREEEALIWQALEQIPATYREPLILFYREDQSVAEVAGALVLSEDAVKQRLSRGRAMLREHVVELVEGGLRRSRPGHRLTMAVMAGLSVQAAGTKSALAGAGAGAWKAASGMAGAGGVLGGIAGTLGGLLGGWLGTWVPAQAAPTLWERDAILRAGRRMLGLSVLFVVALAVLIITVGGSPSYLIFWGIAMVAYGLVLAFMLVRLSGEIGRIRAEHDPDDGPNNTMLRAGWSAAAARIGERVYRSRATFRGPPLSDVKLSAPRPPGASELGDACVKESKPHVARGWVAIGDDARGIVLAIGSTARGLVAVGGRTVGAVSVGGLAFGLVAVGGVGLGVVGLGGLGAGVYALGGGAIGWRAAGGLAMGWDIACGGGAVAKHIAVGGAAVAGDYAVGGTARAAHANDDVARAIVLDQPIVRFAFRLMGQPQVIDQLARSGRPGGQETAPARFRLNNGLSVRIRPIAGAGNVALVVLYNIGGDHDPANQSGLAHLIEHLYVTAPAGRLPGRTVEAFFQSHPAGCNAQTGDRFTVIASVFARGELDKELAEAAARMGDLRVTAADLERERLRMRDEIANMFGRILRLAAVNVARELIRPAPEGGRKGGIPEHVGALKLMDVVSRWQRYYKPRNAIVVVAGDVDMPTARAAVTAHFDKIPSGDAAPAPGAPGTPAAGALREVVVDALPGQSEPVAGLAYAAPQPGSELYAPFLILLARLWSASGQPGRDGASLRPSVYFPLLEDPAALCVSTTLERGETGQRAVERLEEFVALTIAPAFRDAERTSASQTLAFFLGTAEILDFALAQNVYGAALGVARREQMGLDPTALNRQLAGVTEPDVRRAAAEIFAPARHAAALIKPR